MIVQTKYAPKDYVTVTLFGLNYVGRIKSVHFTAPTAFSYEVEFAMNGDIKCKYFHEDEIEGKAND